MRVKLAVVALASVAAFGASQAAYAGSFVEKCYTKTYEQRLVSSRDKVVAPETHAWSPEFYDGGSTVVKTRHPKTVIRTNRYDDQWVLVEGDCRDIIGKPVGARYD